MLKEINPEYSLEGLKLKLQYYDPLMQRADSLEETLMLRKTEGKRRRGQQRMRCLDNMTDSMDMNLSKLQEIVKDRRACMLQSVGSQRVKHNLATDQQKQLKMMVGDSIYTNPISPRLEPPSEKINYKRTVYQKYLNS